jgi:heat-inducible transcriptional repressor
MSFDNLSEREKQILANLVNYYIASADPVGSRVIANRFGMGISSATIRNTLQDLEEFGLVQQPHTSAGRIPTDLGYRVYVDSLLKPEELTQAEKEAIKSAITQDGSGLKEILGQTCKVLSEITKELGVTIAPRFESGVLKRIDLIPVASGRIMVVVILSSGIVRSVIIEVEATISETMLREFEAILNEKLSGLALGVIRDTINKRLADVAGHGRLIKLIVEAKDKLLQNDSGTNINLSGADNLLSQPEFHERDKVSALVKLLEDDRILTDFLHNANEEGLVITIGHENKVDQIMSCSVVTSTYRVGDIAGSIGVIGPTRMPYNKLVSVVEYTARTITEALGGTKKDTTHE